jgi:hypothetical protein
MRTASVIDVISVIDVMSGINSVTVSVAMIRWFDWLLRYVLEPFMTDAVIARPWMHCQGHVAHGTNRLHRLVRFLHSPRPPASYVNLEETCTS